MDLANLPNNNPLTGHAIPAHIYWTAKLFVRFEVGWISLISVVQSSTESSRSMITQERMITFMRWNARACGAWLPQRLS